MDNIKYFNNTYALHYTTVVFYVKYTLGLNTSPFSVYLKIFMNIFEIQYLKILKQSPVWHWILGRVHSTRTSRGHAILAAPTFSSLSILYIKSNAKGGRIGLHSFIDLLPNTRVILNYLPIISYL